MESGTNSRDTARTMSDENLDLVVRAMRAALNRPKPDFDTVNALFHPDHVFVSLGAQVLGEGEAQGGQGYKDWLEETARAVRWEADLKGAVDVGPDTVLVVT